MMRFCSTKKIMHQLCWWTLRNSPFGLTQCSHINWEAYLPLMTLFLDCKFYKFNNLIGISTETRNLHRRIYGIKVATFYRELIAQTSPLCGIPFKVSQAPHISSDGSIAAWNMRTGTDRSSENRKTFELVESVNVWCLWS